MSPEGMSTGGGVNPTAASLLGFLHDGPQTGWELVSRAERMIGPFWSLTRSQVYRELSVLADGGLVVPGPVGRRESRPYTITDEGRREFAAWVGRGPGEATMRLPLLLFVALGRHMAPDLLGAALQQQRLHQAGLLKGYLDVREQVAAGGDGHLLATLDYGIAMARATIRWIDRLPTTLTTSPPP